MKNYLFGLAMVLTALGVRFKAAADDFSNWTTDQTAAIDVQTCNSFAGASWLNLPLDPDHPGDGTFQLFYTLNHPLQRSLPTAIFIDGGPGAVVTPTRNPNLSRIDDSKWNLVMFHVRGAGCSQLPLSVQYDKYITNANVIADIEALRQSLHVTSWDLVIGESFGSWLAQKYAFAKPKSVQRLFLEGIFNPVVYMSQRAQESLDAEQAVIQVSSVLAARSRNLANPPLTDNEVATLVPKIKAAFDALSLADNNAGLPYSREFVEALGQAYYAGTRPIDAQLVSFQTAIAVAVINSFFPHRLSEAEVHLSIQILDLGYADNGEPGKPAYPVISSRTNGLLWPSNDDLTTYPLHTAPTIYINGTLDGATPNSEVGNMVHQSCHDSCLLVQAEGGGHSTSNLRKACIEAFLPEFLKDDLASVANTINHDPRCQDLPGVIATSW